MMTPEKKPVPIDGLSDVILNLRRDVQITIDKSEAVMAKATALLAGSYRIIRNFEGE